MAKFPNDLWEKKITNFLSMLHILSLFQKTLFYTPFFLQLLTGSTPSIFPSEIMAESARIFIRIK